MLIYWKIQVGRNNLQVYNVQFLICLFKLSFVTLARVIMCTIEYNCLDFPADSMFIFDIFWGSLGTSIIGDSSSPVSNTQSRLPSVLSFRFLWLWSDIKPRKFLKRAHTLVFSWRFYKSFQNSHTNYWSAEFQYLSNCSVWTRPWGYKKITNLIEIGNLNTVSGGEANPDLSIIGLEIKRNSVSC